MPHIDPIVPTNPVIGLIKRPRIYGPLPGNRGALPGWESFDYAWILVHMIEETARHVGHLEPERVVGEADGVAERGGERVHRQMTGVGGGLR